MMPVCKSCQVEAGDERVVCDGVCSNIFHPNCLRRSSRSTSSACTTCSDCLEIKPCHIPRLVGNLLKPLTDDQAFMAQKINSLSVDFASLKLFTDDVFSSGDKMDRLLASVDMLISNSNLLLERSHELSSKLHLMSASFDDLRLVLEDCGSSPLSGGAVLPALPIIEDIRRSIGLVRSDLGTWTDAAAKNSATLNSVADGVRNLVSRSMTSASTPPSTLCSAPPVKPTPAVPTIAQPISSHPPTISGDSLPSVRVPERGISIISDDNQSESSSLPVTSDGSLNVVGNSSTNASTTSLPASNRTHDQVLKAPSPGIPPALSSSQDPALKVSISGAPPPAEDAAAPLSVPVPLRAARKPKCVFVSRIHPDTTESDIVNHVSCQTNIPRNFIVCSRINSARRRDGDIFTASFKVFIPDDVFPLVVSPDLWPTGSIVHEFIPRAHRGRRSLLKNSKNLQRFPSATVT